MAKKSLDPNLVAILDSIRATVGSDAPPAARPDEDMPAPAPAAQAGPAPEPPPPLARQPQQTVEEFLAAMIRPQVQAWLDVHLAELVQKITAEEIARIIDRS